MLNGRAILFGILCIFSITSTVFAQSQSATDTIIEKIYQSEIRVREHVDTKVEGVNTKISEIDTKVGTLSKDVEENKTNITNMKDDIRDLKGTVGWIWKGTLGILISIVGYFLRSWRQNQGSKDDVDAVDRLIEQITRLTSAQAEISDQITRLISAQAELPATRDVPRYPKVPRLEGLDELTDDIRSTHHDARETV